MDKIKVIIIAVCITALIIGAMAVLSPMNKKIGNNLSNENNESTDAVAENTLTVPDNDYSFCYAIDDISKTIYITAKYSNDTDIQYKLGKKGANDLFDFWDIYLFNNSDTVKIHDTTSAPEFINGDGDWHAPIKIRAIDNIDGDDPNSSHFTGGNHGYNNSGSGSTATARTESIVFIADGKEITGNEGFASSMEIRWSNYIQATNTKKEDGSGREVLCENHTLIFDGKCFSTSTELVPLEDIKCELWYGLQAFNTPYSYVCYENMPLPGPYETKVDSFCNDISAATFVAFNENNDQMRVSIDTSLDLGTRKFSHSIVDSIFSRDYGKTYFTIINASPILLQGEKYTLNGTLTFKYEKYQPMS